MPLSHKLNKHRFVEAMNCRLRILNHKPHPQLQNKLPLKISHSVEELGITITCPKPKCSRFSSPIGFLHQSKVSLIIFSNLCLLNLIASKTTRFFFRIKRIDNTNDIIFLSLDISQNFFIPLLELPFNMLKFPRRKTRKANNL